MRIAVGSDHAGFDLKVTVLDALRERGHEVLDLGAHDATTSVDYPDFGAAVGRAAVTVLALRGNTSPAAA